MFLPAPKAVHRVAALGRPRVLALHSLSPLTESLRCVTLNDRQIHVHAIPVSEEENSAKRVISEDDVLGLFPAPRRRRETMAWR